GAGRRAPAVAGARGAGADGADGATITVGDTGVGIEPDELPRIFDRFYRGSRANEARASGSGLGLAIVRSIVEMHHGTVEVTSRLGSGTTFTVTLPSDPRREHGPDGTAAEPLQPIEEQADRGKVGDALRVARQRLQGETYTVS